MTTTHLVISTGQNISNFVPLLQFAKTTEHILVVESNTARKNKWGLRLINRLKEHKYHNLSRVDVENGDMLSPLVLGKILRKQLESSETISLNIYLNGGQKLTAVSLLEALRSFNPRLIYMESRPVHFLLLDHFSGQTGAETQPIEYGIDLKDILALYGSGLHSNSARKPIYENGVFLRDIKNPAFSYFWEDTNYIKTLVSLFYKAIQQTFTGYTPQPGTEEIKEIIRERWHSLPLKKLVLESKSKKELKERQIEWGGGFVKSVFRNLYCLNPEPSNIFSSPLNVKVRQQMIENKLLEDAFNEPHIKRPDLQKKLGFYFEEVVLYRVYKFLSARPHILKAIAQIWQNVQVCSAQDPEIVSGEYDILFVLRNGLLISLECKTYKFETKDAFARLARLTIRGGGLAVQWVTAPFYTKPELFHASMYKLWKDMQDLNIPFVPFTATGQKSAFLGADMDTPVSVLGFEEALEKRFAPFLTREKC